jgi:hypothetical protein
MEQRAAISSTGTFETLKSMYDEECLSRASVFEWCKRLKEGLESLQEDEQKGCHSASRTEESNEVIKKVWLNFKLMDVKRNDSD